MVDGYQSIYYPKRLKNEERCKQFIMSQLTLGKTLGKTMINTPTIYYNGFSFCSQFSIL